MALLKTAETLISVHGLPGVWKHQGCIGPSPRETAPAKKPVVAPGLGARRGRATAPPLRGGHAHFRTTAVRRSLRLLTAEPPNLVYGISLVPTHRICSSYHLFFSGPSLQCDFPTPLTSFPVSPLLPNCPWSPLEFPLPCGLSLLTISWPLLQFGCPLRIYFPFSLFRKSTSSGAGDRPVYRSSHSLCHCKALCKDPCSSEPDIFKPCAALLLKTWAWLRAFPSTPIPAILLRGSPHGWPLFSSSSSSVTSFTLPQPAL